MSLVNLDIDADQLHSVIDALAATERQAQQALNSTLPKIAAWMRGKSVKGLAGVTNVPQKVIRRRLKTFRLSKSASGSSITLWYGLDPVGMIYLNAKQGSGGVRAYGGRFVKSGFIATPSNGKRQVFKRRGTARLPIDKQNAEIADKAGIYIEDRVFGTAEFEARFFQIFEHELSWRMQTQK